MIQRKFYRNEHGQMEFYPFLNFQTRILQEHDIPKVKKAVHVWYFLIWLCLPVFYWGMVPGFYAFGVYYLAYFLWMRGFLNNLPAERVRLPFRDWMLEEARKHGWGYLWFSLAVVGVFLYALIWLYQNEPELRFLSIPFLALALIGALLTFACMWLLKKHGT